jgi:hypothetical protein
MQGAGKPLFTGKRGKRQEGGGKRKRAKKIMPKDSVGSDSEFSAGTTSESDSELNGCWTSAHASCRGNSSHEGVVPREWQRIFKNFDTELKSAAKQSELGSKAVQLANVAITALKTVVLVAHDHTAWEIRGDKEKVQGTAALDVGLFVNGLAAPVLNILSQREKAFRKGKGDASRALLKPTEMQEVVREMTPVVSEKRECPRCKRQNSAKAANHSLHACLQILPPHLGLKPKEAQKTSGAGGVRGTGK